MIDTAYYYPAPYWRLEDSDWIKSLLLFFDDVAILLPHYMYGRHTVADPTLAEPLEDRGLLRVLEPNDWIDEEIAGKLAEVVVELLTNGAFNDLPKVDSFAELSQSRMGYGTDVKLAGFWSTSLKREDLRARAKMEFQSRSIQTCARLSLSCSHNSPVSSAKSVKWPFIR